MTRQCICFEDDMTCAICFESVFFKTFSSVTLPQANVDLSCSKQNTSGRSKCFQIKVPLLLILPSKQHKNKHARNIFGMNGFFLVCFEKIDRKWCKRRSKTGETMILRFPNGLDFQQMPEISFNLRIIFISTFRDTL